MAIDIEKMVEGKRKREEQLKNLRHWTETREGYRLQVNFCLPGEPDHTCVTISGIAVADITKMILQKVEEQIGFMEYRIDKAKKEYDKN